MSGKGIDRNAEVPPVKQSEIRAVADKPAVAVAIMKRQDATIKRLRDGIAEIASAATQDINTKYGGVICRRIEVMARDLLDPGYAERMMKAEERWIKALRRISRTRRPRRRTV